ncbi:MAG: Ig-like domain-containing protein [Gemmatimonadales bacterium]|nr:MAG: Ig-like domain-containing protein [Gemmatimonadales bacterium]
MRRSMTEAPRRGHTAAFLLLLGLVAGCSDHHSLTGPDLLDPAELSTFASLSTEGTASTGPGGFYWLPPMAPEPEVTGSFDAELAPRVRICAWDGECAAVVTEFTREGSPASTTVRVDEDDEHYIVNWHTERFDLDPGTPYRILVIVDGPAAGSEWILGYADIRVVASARDLRNVDPAELGVVRGRTLPIRFRVEAGIAASLAVDPPEATIRVGTRQLFTATVRDLHGRVIDGAPVTWSSADPAVADIDQGGWATGQGPGRVVITAASGSVSGTATLTVEAVEECQDCILVPGMDPVVVQAEVGATEVVRFLGEADQRISILLEHLSSFCAAYRILDPDGEDVAARLARCGSWFTDLLVLDATGEYQIEIVHTFGDGIDARITLWEVPPDAQAETAIDGDPGVVVVEAPAQNASVTFDGDAGDAVTVQVSQTWGCGGYELRAPSGEVLWDPFTCGNPFSGPLVLTESGTWTLFLDPNREAIGEAEVLVRSILLDAQAETSIDGEPAVITIDTPGQNALVTFDGAVGDSITVQVIRTFGCTDYELRAPSGAVLWTRFDCGNPFSDLLVLTETGTWTLVIDPRGSTVGEATVFVRSVPPDAQAVTSIDGDPGVVVIEAPAQNAFVTFEGAAGDSITLQVIRTFGCTDYELRAPSGTAFWTRFDCGNPFSDLLVLPESGTWTLVIDPRGSTVGEATVFVRSVPPDAEAVTSIDGDPGVVVIEAPAQNALVTFEGAAGDRISVQVIRTFGCTDYELRAPSGEVLWGPFSCGNPFSDLLVLTETGTWTLVIDPRGSTVGEATVFVRSVPLDAEGAATIGGEPLELAITAPAQNARVWFDGQASQQVLIQSDRVSSGCARYTLSGPDGEVIGGLNRVLRCGALSENVTLPSSGTYTLLIDPDGTWTGLTRTTVSEP